MASNAAETAESLFDTLGARYEDAFANDPLLCTFIASVSKRLPAKSKVLDVGCGTGKPVSHQLAQAGHAVYGIDVSAEMVRLAGSQVPGGIFQQADMREYQPPVQMDAVFAVLSLFQLTPGDLVSMMYKFAEWVRVDGFVALCVLPSTALAPQKIVYDPTWDAVWMIGKEWMGSLTNESFFSEEGWIRILRQAGFVLEVEPVSYLFSPIGENHIPEAHYCLTARRVEKTPLLGPFPWPSDQGGPGACRTNGKIVKDKRLMSEDLGRLLEGMGQKSVFTLQGNGQGCCSSDASAKSPNGTNGSHDIDGHVSPSSTSSGEVETVFIPWTLHNAVDINHTLAEAVRISPSRVIVLQGAPDNEATQLINAVARSAFIPHQGRLTGLAREYLAIQGFGDLSLQRIRARLSFPEKDLPRRCTAAADFLIALWHPDHPQREEMTEIMVHRLQLLFEGHGHSIGFDMVALIANRLSNGGVRIPEVI